LEQKQGILSSASFFPHPPSTQPPLGLFLTK
jgi:hypothetical protein